MNNRFKNQLIHFPQWFPSIIDPFFFLSPNFSPSVFPDTFRAFSNFGSWSHSANLGNKTWFCHFDAFFITSKENLNHTVNVGTPYRHSIWLHNYTFRSTFIHLCGVREHDFFIKNQALLWWVNRRVLKK